MQTSAKPQLILIDDEQRILRSLSMLFRAQYNVQATTNPQQVLDWVSRQPIHVVLSDQKMPLMRGAELLRQVRERSPHTMRLLLTGYSELDAIVASVNEGEIFRYIAKPWDSVALRKAVDEAAAIAQKLFASAAVSAPRAAEAPIAADCAVLVIDQDPEVPQLIRELSPGMTVHWARTLDQATTLLSEQTIGVLVAELMLGKESVAPLLKVLKAQHPELVSIVMTSFQDTGALVGLINQGQVYRFVPKPPRRGPLGLSLASAIRYHRQLRSSPALTAMHAVERIQQPEEAGLAGRLMGALSRLRRRPGLG